MTKPLTEPTQLVIGISHRQMLDMMADAGIFCGTDKFARILQLAQARALASRNTLDASIDRALDAIPEDAKIDNYLTREEN